MKSKELLPKTTRQKAHYRVLFTQVNVVSAASAQHAGGMAFLRVSHVLA